MCDFFLAGQCDIWDYHTFVSGVKQHNSGKLPLNCIFTQPTNAKIAYWGKSVKGKKAKRFFKKLSQHRNFKPSVLYPSQLVRQPSQGSLICLHYEPYISTSMQEWKPVTQKCHNEQIICVMVSDWLHSQPRLCLGKRAQLNLLANLVKHPGIYVGWSQY